MRDGPTGIRTVGLMSDPELMHVSEPVRRFEVFTGSGRRRSWTAEEKARIFAESYGFGDTVC